MTAVLGFFKHLEVSLFVLGREWINFRMSVVIWSTSQDWAADGGDGRVCQGGLVMDDSRTGTAQLLC